LRVNTSIGELVIPQHAGQILLDGHQSKIIVTDFSIGKQKLTYSTAEVLTYALIDGSPTVVLWVPEGEAAEFHVKNARKGSVQVKGGSEVKFHKDRSGLVANLQGVKGMSVLQFDNGVRAVVADRATAYLFWAPNLSEDPFGPVDQSGKFYFCNHYRL
jgi:hypothetical protein